MRWPELAFGMCDWNGPDDKAPAIVDAYVAGAKDVLAATAQAVG